MAHGRDSGDDYNRQVGRWRWPEGNRGAGSACPSCGGPTVNQGPIGPHGKTDYSRCDSCGTDSPEGFRMPPGKSIG